jgi:hypothetical protein
MKFVETMTIFDFFVRYMEKMVGAGAEIFDKLEPHKNRPAPQHWKLQWVSLYSNHRQILAFFRYQK